MHLLDLLGGCVAGKEGGVLGGKAPAGWEACIHYDDSPVRLLYEIRGVDISVHCACTVKSPHPEARFGHDPAGFIRSEGPGGIGLEWGAFHPLANVIVALVGSFHGRDLGPVSYTHLRAHET